MPTSYANPGGSGDRTATVVTTSEPSDLFAAGNLAKLINGDLTANDCFFNVRSSCIMKFQFDQPKIIDTFRWKQSNGNPHGDWKWFGSNNDVSYDPLGSDFTLVGVSGGAFNEILEPAGNTNAYIFYKMVQQTSGTGSGPFLYEIEFKIEDGVAIITGTLAVTDAPDVISITSTIPISGTLAVTDAPDVVAMHDGTHAGELHVTEEPDSVNFFGATRRRPATVVIVANN